MGESNKSARASHGIHTAESSEASLQNEDLCEKPDTPVRLARARCGSHVPLMRGSCDCPANMQWQTIEEAKAKDKWE